jgi:hypothetical protein
MRRLPVRCYKDPGAAAQVRPARKKSEDSNAAFSIEVTASRRHERKENLS